MIGHPVLTPGGELIELSSRDIRQLRQAGLILPRRKPNRPYPQIKAVYFDLVREGKLFFANILHRPLRANRYQESSSPKKSTASRLVNVLGSDCSGPNVLSMRTAEGHRILEELDHTASPHGGRRR